MKKIIKNSILVVLFILIMIGSGYANVWITRKMAGSSELENRVAKLEQRVEKLEKNKAIDLGNFIEDISKGVKSE